MRAEGTSSATMWMRSKRDGRGGVVVTEAAATDTLNLKVLTSLDELDMERGACVIAPKYSPVLVRERALSSPLECVRTAARGVEILWAAGTFAGALLYDKFQKSEDVVSRSDQLRIMLAELGPSFVKAGQVLANRPDIVRADYMEQLCKLQDDVPPFPNEQARDGMGWDGTGRRVERLKKKK